MFAKHREALGLWLIRLESSTWLVVTGCGQHRPQWRLGDIAPQRPRPSVLVVKRNVFKKRALTWGVPPTLPVFPEKFAFPPSLAPSLPAQQPQTTPVLPTEDCRGGHPNLSPRGAPGEPRGGGGRGGHGEERAAPKRFLVGAQAGLPRRAPPCPTEWGGPQGNSSASRVSSCLPGQERAESTSSTRWKQPGTRSCLSSGRPPLLRL